MECFCFLVFLKNAGLRVFFVFVVVRVNFKSKVYVVIQHSTYYDQIHLLWF